ncbi:MAG: caspase family protein [Saprospiraceae bacterium]|nr:caspase family protein [Saprospiraceae bacterium]MDW8228860.1 caspase family protein [Saprospiraceae bacterium]
MKIGVRPFVFIVGCLLLAAMVSAQAPELIIPTRLGKPHNVLSVQGNKYFLVMGENSTQIWESSSGRLLKTLKITAFRGVETQDGKTLFLTGRSMVYMINTANFALMDSMYVLGMRQLGVSPDPSQVYAYTSNTRGVVLAINLARKRVDTLFVFPVGDISTLKSFGVTSDGRYSIAQVDKSPAYLIDNASKQVIKTFDTPGNLYAFTPDNKLLEIAIANGQGTLSILNPVTFSPEVTVSGPTKVEPYSIKNMFWLDNRRVFLYNYEQHTIADFNKRTLGPDFKYHSAVYHSIDHTCPARKENGSVRTVYLSISHPENRMEEWDLITRQKIREVGDAIVSPFYSTLAPDDFRFQYGKDCEVVLGRTVNFLKVNTQNEISVYSPDGKYRVHTGTMGVVEKFRSQEQNAQLQASARLNGNGSAIVVGKNGKVGAVINTGGMYLFDAQTMTILREVTINPQTYIIVEPKLGTFFDNDRKIIASAILPDNSPQAYCVEVASGKILWTLKGEYVSFQETSEGILCFDKKEKNLKVLRPQNGQVVKTHYLWNVPISGLEVMRAAISPDASQVLFASSSKISFWDMKAQKVILPNYNPLTDYVHTLDYFKHNPRYALSISNDGRIVLWDSREAAALATLFLFPKTNDWVCLTPDGRFDASPDAMRKLYYVKGMDIIPLEQLYERYYTPGLLAQLLGGTPLPPVNPDEDIKKLKRPPVVKIQYQDKQRNLVVDDDDVPTLTVAQSPITLTVEAYAPDDVVDEIRLFHNGKLVAGSVRGLVVDDDKKQRETRSFTLELLPGENRFRAIALNSQRTESSPAELALQYTPTTPTPAPSGGDITLHALIVGINKYKNPKYNLNYALADATAFREQLQQSSTGIFKGIEVAFIADEQATLSNIAAALEKIKTTAQARDVFVFYYAGHGVLNEKRMFYLVPHDVTQLYGNDEALEAKGLSASALQQYSKDIKAQKQLYLLDACQSAGALEQVAVRGAAEEKAISQLARATGTHWLTASGSEQFASEFAQLGHGTFTYALLEALKGKADNGDKRITVKEIDAYLQAIVPELTARYKGTPQYPASFGFGNDFPVGVVR